VGLQEAAQRTSGYAIASLILGIAGFMFFPLVPSILAVVFGRKAQEEIRRGAATGDGLATAGIILGWVGIAVCAAGAVFFLLLAAAWA
jgi:hypothetical protein